MADVIEITGGSAIRAFIRSVASEDTMLINMHKNLTVSFLGLPWHVYTPQDNGIENLYLALEQIQHSQIIFYSMFGKRDFLPFRKLFREYAKGKLKRIILIWSGSLSEQLGVEMTPTEEAVAEVLYNREGYTTIKDLFDILGTSRRRILACIDNMQVKDLPIVYRRYKGYIWLKE
jgi:hypothetical protein